MRKYRLLWFALAVTLAVCGGCILLCYVVGPRLAARHMEEHLALSMIPGFLALTLGLMMISLEPIRKWYWFSIPALLGLTAFAMYRIAINFPCCVGG